MERQLSTATCNFNDGNFYAISLWLKSGENFKEMKTFGMNGCASNRRFKA